MHSILHHDQLRLLLVLLLGYLAVIVSMRPPLVRPLGPRTMGSGYILTDEL